MSRYDASLNLIGVLDHLRDAYDLAKEAGHLELQEHLMSARRQLVQAVHQCLNLHSELAEAQDQLARAKGEVPQAASSVRASRPMPDSIPRQVS